MHNDYFTTMFGFCKSGRGVLTLFAISLCKYIKNMHNHATRRVRTRKPKRPSSRSTKNRLELQEQTTWSCMDVLNAISTFINPRTKTQIALLLLMRTVPCAAILASTRWTSPTRCVYWSASHVMNQLLFSLTSRFDVCRGLSIFLCASGCNNF